MSKFVDIFWCFTRERGVCLCVFCIEAFIQRDRGMLGILKNHGVQNMRGIFYNNLIARNKREKEKKRIISWFLAQGKKQRRAERDRGSFI